MIFFLKKQYERHIKIIIYTYVYLLLLAQKMRAILNRQHTVTVKNIDKFIFKMRDIKLVRGAYAVNRVRMVLDNNEDTEEVVYRFVDEFQKVSKNFINLKTLCIYSPYATYDGGLIKLIMNTPSTFTNLELDVFGFHSPQDDMWLSSSVDLKNIDVTFRDGIAFPKSGTDMFNGISKAHKLDSVKISNESPYTPTMSLHSKLRRSMYIVRGVNVVYY